MFKCIIDSFPQIIKGKIIRLISVLLAPSDFSACLKTNGYGFQSLTGKNIILKILRPNLPLLFVQK